MTKDFQKTLNATQYPNLHIKFLNFSKKENNKYIATVEVKMMTKTVKYTIDFVSSKNRLIGQETVKFSDFGIVPPKKMGGMIVVKDHLNLVFNMALTNWFSSFFFHNLLFSNGTKKGCKAFKQGCFLSL